MAISDAAMSPPRPGYVFVSERMRSKSSRTRAAMPRQGLYLDTRMGTATQRFLSRLFDPSCRCRYGEHTEIARWAMRATQARQPRPG